MIRQHFNLVVGVSTVARIIVLGILAALFANYTSLDGASLVMLSISLGAVAEALLVRFMGRKAVVNIMAVEESTEQPSMDYKRIASFYFPLGVMNLLLMLSFPLLTIVITHGIMPLESLAVFPLLDNFAHLWNTTLLAIQELVISVTWQSRAHYAALKRFSLMLLALLLIGLFILLFSSLIDLLLVSLYGLSSELVNFGSNPARLLFVFPVLAFAACWQRGSLVLARRTAAITWSSLLEMIGSVAVAWLFVENTTLSALYCGLLGLIVGRSFGVLVMLPSYLSVRAEREEIKFA